MSLPIKLESALGLVFGVRAQTEMKIWCITGMSMLKVVSSETILLMVPHGVLLGLIESDAVSWCLMMSYGVL